VEAVHIGLRALQVAQGQQLMADGTAA